MKLKLHNRYFTNFPVWLRILGSQQRIHGKLMLLINGCMWMLLSIKWYMYQFVSNAKNQSVTSHLKRTIQTSLPLRAYSMNG